MCVLWACVSSSLYLRGWVCARTLYECKKICACICVFMRVRVSERYIKSTLLCIHIQENLNNYANVVRTSDF